MYMYRYVCNVVRVRTYIRNWRIMLDIKPNSAFLSAWNSARQVVNSAQNSAEILLWLLMLSRHFPTHAVVVVVVVFIILLGRSQQTSLLQGTLGEV